MQRTETIIIGAGQAGLATSRLLTDEGRDHLVLDRGRLAERWRSQRWDSLRLLTPNWMSRLPGYQYTGPEPEGFMTASELVRYFETYARTFDAPIQEETAVDVVEPIGDGYRVMTNQGSMVADNVVVATGFADVPKIPAMARRLPPDVLQIDPTRYRKPQQIPDGGVLVVGASASGVQIADELRRAGRDVTIAVGSHRRVPRRYRGVDIMWWLEVIGAYDVTVDDVVDFERGRQEPSLQLVGRPTNDNLDLQTLAENGVRLAGRLQSVDGRNLTFDDDLAVTTGEADRRLRRLLAGIDTHIERTGLSTEVLDPEPLVAVPTAGAPRQLDLRAAGIHTVVWATGYGRNYDWLRVPVFEPSGEISQYQGVTASPGLYVVGMWFQHWRNSSFIDGARRDARTVVDHLVSRRLAPAAA